MPWSDYWNTIEGVRALGDKVQYTAIVLAVLAALLGLVKQAAVVRERGLATEVAAKKEQAFNDKIDSAQQDAKDAQDRAERAKADAERAQELATRDIAKPVAPGLAGSTHSALAAWHAKHTDVRLVVNRWGTGTMNLTEAVDSVTATLKAAGIEFSLGMSVATFGVVGAQPLGPEIRAPEELGSAAEVLRKALSGLTPGASIARPGGEPKVISITFRGVPSFAPDGSITFR